VEFVNELSRLEPFGNGNPKPVFADRALRVSRLAVRGKNRNVAGFLLKDAGGFSVEGIYFGEADRFVEDVTKHGSCINILYYPQLNTFRGTTTLQVVVTSYQFPKK
jgi:single-stranded-DNA-specific exonuclease